MEFYQKIGRKYKKVYETPRLYSDGVWLVSNDGCSHQCILKLGELKELYPFAQMMQESDKLAGFLTRLGMDRIGGSLKKDKDGNISYSFGAAAETAKEILKFLAMTGEEKEEYLEVLNKNDYHINSDGCLMRGWQRVTTNPHDVRLIKQKIKEREEEIKQLKELLN